MRPLVLNTRSTHQADEFSALLNQAGFDVLEIPALEIRTLDCSARIISALRGLSPQSIVAFTSANAASMATQDSDVRDLLKQLKIAAIGNKTASTLNDAGVSVHLQSTQSSSEDLAGLIAARKPDKVLYLSGLPNTGTLKNKLSELTDFSEIPVYTSSPSQGLKNNIMEHKAQLLKVEYFVFLSKEALNAFHDATTSQAISLKEIKCMVISQGIADAARALGYEKIFVSQARSVEAIVTSLSSLSTGVV